MTKRADNYLLISDLQWPFEDEEALAFCRRVQKEFKIPHENIYNVGDETDLYFLSRYPKSVMRNHTAMMELEEVQARVKDWAKVFPKMKLCNSNHKDRWLQKALAADIPSVMIRQYREMIGAPGTWRWKDKWVVKTKHPFLVTHGTGYSGKFAHRNIAIDMCMSTAIGHLHAGGGVQHINTAAGMIWGMNTGCLIDDEAYAFEYNKNDRYRPTKGLGVVLDNGRMPIFVPFGSV